MKLRSFRLRIALLSATLAGGALVGFGVVSWWWIYQANVNRLDAKLKAWLSRPPVKERLQSDETALRDELEIDKETPIALLVMDRDGKTVYRSKHWTAELNLQGLSPSALPPPGFPPDERKPPPSSRTEPLFPEEPPFPPEPPPDVRPRPPKPKLVTQHTAAGTWHVGTVVFPDVQVAIAISLQAIDRDMTVIRDIFLISIPIVLLLVAGGAWGLSGSALHPIRQLSVAIQQVTVKGLERRVPIGATDVEFLELIQVFNQMLERLERSFKQASRFSGDAAHELKTPLAILQGELERTLQQAQPGSEVQQSLSNLLDEVRGLSTIVRKLLLLSLADAGQMSLYRVEVNLSEVLGEMVEDMELLAPDLEVQTEIADGLRVFGDRDLLAQVLHNLLSNAIKYNVPNGWMRISARQQGTTVIVTIGNSSQDIPASERERIFDRFYRGDSARMRKIEGTGLGLSLAREIALAHGGNLTLDSTPNGQSSFTFSLPVETPV